MKTKQHIIALLCILILCSSCEKYLDAKPDQRLSTIETLTDMQALLDNYNDLNYKDPAMGEACGDNYFLTDAVYSARSETDRNLYIWAGANVFQSEANAWYSSYSQIGIVNTVLQAAKEKENSIADKQKLLNIQAQALFFRAKCFLQVAGVWSMPYDSSTADQLPGIPLPLTADFNQKSSRPSVRETYQRIIQDLKEATPNLPSKDISPARPSKAAAFGMISRAFLQMREYTEAGLYADSCLQIQSALLDYNTLSASANFPIAKLNAEVIFEGKFSPSTLTNQARSFVVPELYAQYAANDLRKTIFFRASGTNYIFKGNYEGAATFFNGIATDEMLLTRSECNIRAGKTDDGLRDLNLLLKNRYKTGTFIALSGLSASQALTMVKAERRKELIFRALRWADIRRFNLEGDNLVLKRTVNGIDYTLQPNSLLYALAIPEDVIRLSGIVQNPR